MNVQPYLMFDGRCEEAIAFYRGALGAEVEMLMRNRENPEGGMVRAGTEDKIMHASLRFGGTTVMMSDGHCSGQPSFQGFSLTIMPPDDAAGARVFAALTEGGSVQMPMSPTFFASSFGIVTDRFGVSWMVYVQPAA